MINMKQFLLIVILGFYACSASCKECFPLSNSGIDRVIIYALEPLASTPWDLDRTTFFDQWIFDGMKSKTFKDKSEISTLVDQLSRLKLIKTLDYDTLESDTQVGLSAKGNYYFKHQSPDPKGAIIVLYNNGDYELIWINQFTINVKNGLYDTSKYFKELVIQVGRIEAELPASLTPIYSSRVRPY